MEISWNLTRWSAAWKRIKHKFQLDLLKQELSLNFSLQKDRQLKSENHSSLSTQKEKNQLKHLPLLHLNLMARKEKLLVNPLLQQVLQLLQLQLVQLVKQVLCHSLERRKHLSLQLKWRFVSELRNCLLFLSKETACYAKKRMGREKQNREKRTSQQNETTYW